MISILLALAVAGILQSKPAPAAKTDVVAVAGCLRESAPDKWTLENATDPVASNANASLPKELAAMPKAGKNTFQLIGVGIFNLADHRGHNLVVKGLLIKATPVARLNLTSVTMVSAECPAK